MSRRINKVNELLKQEISNIILKELDFDKSVMITIKEVRTSSDLQQAKIKVSIIPFLRAEKVLKILNSQIFHIWQELAKKISIRIVPKIKFVLDESEEKTSRVEQLLKKTNQ